MTSELFKMAALGRTTFLTCYHYKLFPLFSSSIKTKSNSIIPSTTTYAAALCRKSLSGSNRDLGGNIKVLPNQLLSQRQQSTSSSTESDGLDQSDLIKDFEVSYDEFKYVEDILPSVTVPELTEHAQYPTPSGWFPPNEALQAEQKYLVRRTKNHMLPVYLTKQETWYGTAHYVVIKKIEGDIWALEADLREHILNITGNKKVNTQVHEVGRFIRVRGQHTDTVANFLFERGM